MLGAIHANNSPVTIAQVTPLARLTGETHVVVVPGSSKIQSLKELIAEFKANPGGVSWSGGSAGGTDHMAVGLIAKAVGVDPRKINYIAYAGGGEAQTAVLGGHVTAGISNYGEFASQIKSGKIRALGVTSDKRIPGVDIPTLKEQGVDVELFNWRSIFAAPGISEAQKRELMEAVERTVKSEAWQATLKRSEWTDMYLPADQFQAFLASEQTRVATILDGLGLARK